VLLLIQVLMLVAFLHYVNRVFAEHGDNLDTMYDDDVAVAKLEADAKRYADVARRVGSFDKAPMQMKLALGSGVVAAVLSTYALMFGGSMLFQPFRITDCLKTTLGMPRSDYIIWFLGMKPAGAACIVLMLYGALCLKVYQSCWVGAQTTKSLKGVHDLPSEFSQATAQSLSDREKQNSTPPL